MILRLKMEKLSLFDYINIFIGLITIAFSLIVIIYANIALITLIILLSITLLVAGAGRVYNSFLDKNLNKIGKILKFGTGLLAIIMSITIILILVINPMFSIVLLINLLGYTLIVIGIVRIFIGIMVEKYPKKYRFILILVGIICFVFAFLVLVFPTLGYFLIVIFLSISLLVNGLARMSYVLLGKN